MTKTVIIEQFGDADCMQLVDTEIGQPGAGQVRVAHKACGLNYNDVYQRTGLYPLQLPHALGMEAAGVIEAVGEGVTHVKPGDRVAYAAQPPGAYCQARVMPAAQVCPLPDGISFEQGAAMMLQGLTVEYLFHRTTPLKRGDTVLFHAAAGGVGLIACQWARSEGITLLGTAGSDEKCAACVELGAEKAINYREEDFVEVLRTEGGADVILDMVGGPYIQRNLKALADDGRLVQIAFLQGMKAELNLVHLMTRRLTITGSTLRPQSDLAKARIADDLRREVWPLLASGRVAPVMDQEFALEDASAAHARMESSAHIGKIVLKI